MSDLRRRLHRTIPVVILDTVLGLVAALQSGHLPRPGSGGDGRRPGGGPDRRRTVRWLAAAAALVVIGTGVLVVAFLQSSQGLAPLGMGPPPPVVSAPPPGTEPATPATPEPEDDEPDDAGEESSPPSPTATPSRPPAGPDRNGSGDDEPVGAGPAGPPPLTADFTVTDEALLGYDAEVEIGNRGRSVREGWRLTVTLPRSTLRIDEVSGARVRRQGETWTFTPVDSTARVPANGSVKVSFEVNGANLGSATPTDCRIDGRRCSGLPD